MDERIKVKFILTSVLRLRFKRNEIELLLAPGATLREAIQTLVSQYAPDASEFIFDSAGNLKVRCIVNKGLANLDDELPDNSEVIILSQVGGG